MRIPLLVSLLVLLSLALVLPSSGCGPDDHKGEIIYQVRLPDGGVPEQRTIAALVSELDLRLEEAGYPRRDVSSLGDGRVRIVLPESVVSQMAKIRAALEQPEGLNVTLTLSKR